MALTGAAEKLYTDTQVQSFIKASRNEAQQYEVHSCMPWDEPADIRREGKYPLVSHEGSYEATLWRTLPVFKEDQSYSFRGGEFRILANSALTKEVSMTEKSEKCILIVDSTPIFLRELSDSGVQRDLSVAREKIADSDYPAALIQTRASDIHDGEYRNRVDGQLDLQEEIWYAKVLNIMKLYPGMNFLQASQILVGLGEKKFIADYGLGVMTVIDRYYDGQIPSQLEVDVIQGTQYIAAFSVDHEPSYQTEALISEQGQKIKEHLQAQMDAREQTVHVKDKTYHVSTLATYPLMQDGVEFQVSLVKVKSEDSISFQTFRILQYGNIHDAFVRVDSICVNGVQAGDTHCDCRQQTEVEKKRAQVGMPILLINVRDDEGRFHGEGMKGGTLAVERAVNEYITTSLLKDDIGLIGNGIAAQLFYHETGNEVDARSFDTTQALLQYMNIQEISHLVTDNKMKIEAISQVCRIGEVVTAEVVEGLTEEARQTIKNKREGHIPGAQYQFKPSLAAI